MKKEKKNKNLIPLFSGILLLWLMIAAAEITGEREIIFPEMAAITMGTVMLPNRSWNVSSKRLFILILIGALSGIAVVTAGQKFLIPVWLQLPLAFLIAETILLLSKTEFFPLISAVTLPVLLQSTSKWYIGSAVFFTLFALIVSKILSKNNLINKYTYIKKVTPGMEPYRFFLRFLFILPLSYIAFRFKVPFILAPPILVAFTSLGDENSPMNSHKKGTVTVITLSALFGSIIRYLFTIKAGLSPLISILFLIALLYILYSKTGAYIPPAAACGFLAYLIPESSIILYPIELATGSFILFFLSKHVLNRKKHVV